MAIKSLLAFDPVNKKQLIIDTCVYVKRCPMLFCRVFNGLSRAVCCWSFVYLIDQQSSFGCIRIMFKMSRRLGAMYARRDIKVDIQFILLPSQLIAISDKRCKAFCGFFLFFISLYILQNRIGHVVILPQCLPSFPSSTAFYFFFCVFYYAGCLLLSHFYRSPIVDVEYTMNFKEEHFSCLTDEGYPVGAAH